MATKAIQDYTNLGNIADGDKLLGERVDGTTVRITFNGVLYDADFTTDGFLTRTASATYANRTHTGSSSITIADGDGVSGNPTYTINASYVGQASLTTLGTITTGTWNASVINVPYGGTGRASATAYAPLVGGVTSTGAHQSMASGATGQIMQSAGNSAIPTWSTATFPSTATASGTRLKANGTNWVATTTTMPDSGTTGRLIRGDGTNYVETTSTFADTYGASQILYSNGANAVQGLATANSGVLITSAGGVPSIGTDIPTAVTIGSSYIYRAGGTDVPVTDGGTGVSTMTTAYAPVCAGTTATGALQVASTGLSTSGYVLTSNGASAVPSFQAVSTTESPQVPGGRITLATATPVMVSDQAAKTTIYYSPYITATVPIYNGSTWTNTAFTELSVATTDTAKSPAAIGASKVNDWFVWSDSGTLRVGHGPDWTNDTTRSAGTALTLVNGIYLNNASITNGPAASRGTYVGTTRSNASSQLDWILGGDANDGSPASLFVWNMYNRVNIGKVIRDTRSSHSYTTAAYQGINATTGMRLNMVTGLNEENVTTTFTLIATTSSASVALAGGIGLDSTSTNIGTAGYTLLSVGSGNLISSTSLWSGTIGLGVHYVAALEYGAAGTTQYGLSAPAQSGMTYQTRM